jgi:hypothetical protein
VRNELAEEVRDAGDEGGGTIIGLPSILTTKREGKEEQDSLFALAGLSSYLCRLCPLCQSAQAMGR